MLHLSKGTGLEIGVFQLSRRGVTVRGGNSVLHGDQGGNLPR